MDNFWFAVFMGVKRAYVARRCSIAQEIFTKVFYPVDSKHTFLCHVLRVTLCVMIDEEIPQDSDVEEFLNASPGQTTQKQRKKDVNPVGRAFYGERFEGFDKMETMRDLLPMFKGFYYDARIRHPQMTGKKIMADFNETVVFPMGRTFFPHMNNLKNWRAKWDLDIANQRKEQTGEEITTVAVRKKTVAQVLKTRDENDNLILGTGYDEIEAGTTTLAGELMNDALQMLRDDQELGEVYDDEVLIKRRNYIVNVFGHVNKLVHGKASLLLKASQEKRENASFLMTLMAKATAGNLSEEEMGALKSTYRPEPIQVHEEPAQL